MAGISFLAGGLSAFPSNDIVDVGGCKVNEDKSFAERRKCASRVFRGEAVGVELEQALALLGGLA
ncbi:hypothetical protein SAMN05216456_0847 [Devosia crocina]|uniref:Uncharacterized protein n=1 Tax=Devosia crocina TaxID=429728 RepID=A0A1I7N5A9_9HYPH|nr:hypothetical protein SAMN05216456_0847 [Devosia crocina]